MTALPVQLGDNVHSSQDCASCGIKINTLLFVSYRVDGENQGTPTGFKKKEGISCVQMVECICNVSVLTNNAELSI